MQRSIVTFCAGLLFSVGLTVSGMTKPAKVQGFLDVSGRWDPSLAFVMMGALAVAFVGFRAAQRRGAPVYDAQFYLPTKRAIDGRLVFGSVLFGVGWGLSGYCPGPALVSLVSATPQALLFAVSMVGGMLLFDVYERLVAAKPSEAPQASRA